MDSSTPIDKQYRPTSIFVVGQESETTELNKPEQKAHQRKTEGQKKSGSFAVDESLQKSLWATLFNQS